MQPVERPGNGMRTGNDRFSSTHCRRSSQRDFDDSFQASTAIHSHIDWLVADKTGHAR